MAAKNKQTTASKVASVISIPGYEIKDLLGRGGMAMVYLAVQKSIDREVALKVLSPDHTDETFSERFLSEARIASHLAHPNIITIFDAGIHNDIHYMSMEYIKGKSFNEARDLLTRKQKIAVIKQIAQALDFASKKGFVHRDIKPENILLHQDDRAILTDFGIAKATDVSKGLTETGKILGTPYFMSPEQTKGLDIDHRTDIYSLGVVLFQALAGYVPYDGPSLVSICIKHLSDPIPQLPKGLEIFQPIINVCMSKKPEHRYQHASELYDALNSISDAQLDQIDSAVKQLKKSGQDHNADTMMDSVQEKPQRKVIKREIQNHNYIKPDKQNFVTNSADFKNLNRRKRKTLLILLIIGVAIGYYKRDDLEKFWFLKGEPIAKKYLPQEYKKYLPINPDTIIVKNTKPIIKSKSKTEMESEKNIQLFNSIDKIPSNAKILAQRYSKKLESSPNNTELLSKIELLKNWYLNRVTILTHEKDFISASKTIKTIITLYPDIQYNDEFLALKDKLELDKNNEPYLQKSRVYFAVNALNTPAGANALEQLKLVLATDPLNKEALNGLRKIATHYTFKAKLEIKNKKHFKALNSVNSGLQAIFNDPELLRLQKKLKSLINNTNDLKSLLQKAAKLLSEGKAITPQGTSAYSLYNSVLKREPGNAVAKDGLKRIHNQITKKINFSISQNKFHEAREALNNAHNFFPNSSTIKKLKINLQKEMNAVLPIVPKIKISVSPFNNIDQTTLRKIKIGQLLYIGFQYNNFTQENTLLTANVYNGDPAKLIIEKSLVIEGKAGAHFFTIQLPKTGITNGDYSIELLLGNSRLIKANLFGIH